MMQAIRQDALFALRRLARTPAFTSTAVLILAVGLGACATIFTLIESVVLRPLPYPDPDRLVMVWETTREEPNRPHVVSAPNAADWRDRASSFAELAAFNLSWLAVPGQDGLLRVPGAAVTGGYFDVLGVEPQAGRPILEADDVPNGPRVVVISHEFWQRHFGGERNIVGRMLPAEGRPYEIVGVMPAGFQGPEEHFFGRSDFWMPLQMDMRASPRGGRWMRTIARLRAGVTLEQAASEMSAIAAGIATAHPDSNAGYGATVVALHEQITRDVRPALLVLLGAVALVHLIVCANVASLLLSRGVARARELALRAALGAGRWRLVQGVAVENVFLAMAGALLAVLVAAWATPAIVSLWPGLPRASAIGLGGRAVAFTFAIAAIASLVFGLFTGMSLSRLDPARTLQESGRTGSEGTGRRRVRHALVVVEVAVSLALLIGGALLMRNFARLTARDPGFRAEGVLTARLELPVAGAQAPPMLHDVLDRVRAIPGVQSAGAVTSLPFYGLNNAGLRAAFQTLDRGTVEHATRYRAVTPGYLEAMALRLRSGRLLADTDREGAAGALVVNTEVARQVFRGASPLGRTVTIDFNGVFTGTIVGVVDAVRHDSLLTGIEPEVYVPFVQHPSLSTMFIAARTGRDPVSLGPAIRGAAGQAHPRVIVESIRPLEDLVAASVAPERFNTAMMGILATVALALALVGLYAVASHSVAQRAREIGIRLALGAQRGHVLRHVLSEGLWLTAAGIAIGLVIALPVTAAIARWLVDVRPRDPATFVGVPLAVAAVALVASYMPARRASRLDPVESLRIE